MLPHYLSVTILQYDITVDNTSSVLVKCNDSGANISTISCKSNGEWSNKIDCSVPQQLYTGGLMVQHNIAICNHIISIFLDSTTIFTRSFKCVH